MKVKLYDQSGHLISGYVRVDGVTFNRGYLWMRRGWNYHIKVPRSKYHHYTIEED